MTKVETKDLLSVPQAAELRGTTRQAINYLLRQGKLPFVEIAGKRFIDRKVLENFEPDKGGRPPKEPTIDKRKARKKNG